MRVNLAAWTVAVNQTNVLGGGRGDGGGRKFVTGFNIRNSFTWVVTGEQLQVAESQPKSLQRRGWDPCQPRGDGFASWKGARQAGKGGCRLGRRVLKKLSLEAGACLIGLEHMSLEAEHSQPAGLVNQPARGKAGPGCSPGRTAGRWPSAWGPSRGGPGWWRDCGSSLRSDTLFCGLGASICPTPGPTTTPSLSTEPAMLRPSRGDVAQARPPTASASPGEGSGTAASSVGMGPAGLKGLLGCDFASGGLSDRWWGRVR